jgi:hypothetical protein
MRGGEPNNLQLEFFLSRVTPPSVLDMTGTTRILNAGHFQNSLQDFEGIPTTNTLRKFLEAFILLKELGARIGTVGR